MNRGNNSKTIPSAPHNKPTISVRGTSYVEIHGAVSVSASEMAVVSVYGDSDVHASGSATVIAWSGRPRVTLTEDAILVDRSNAIAKKGSDR